MKQEAALKSRLYRELRDRLTGFYVLEYATRGAPDREIVGAGITTRWEMKHATPDFKSPGDQELMCCRLAAAGHCRYIIWYERWTTRKTLIVHPQQVHNRYGWELEAEASCDGFDMRWVVAQIRKAHRC